MKNRIKSFVYDLESRMYQGVFKLSLEAVSTILEKKFHDTHSPKELLEKFKVFFSTYSNFFAEINARAYLAKAKTLPKNDDQLLSEVLAQKAGRVYEKQENTTVSLIDILKGAYGLEKPEDIDKVILTSQLIDRLRVLGKGDNEIAKLLSEHAFDKDTLTFGKLDQEVERMAQEQGMDLDDVDTQIDIMRLRKHNENLKAAIIAQDELRKFQPAAGFVKE